MDDAQEAAQAKVAAIESGLMRDAVRKEAAAYGLLDPSDIDNVSLEGVSIASNGSVVGAKELVEKFKTSKPHWFAGSPGALREKQALAQVNADYNKLKKDVKPGSLEHTRKLEEDYFNRLSQR